MSAITAPSDEAKAASNVFAMIDHIEKYGSDEVKTYMIDKEIWFRANDVAHILGYKDQKAAVSAHVNKLDKKPLKELFGVGAQYPHLEINQNDLKSTYINETGLYDLIFSCTLDTAQLFRHWITTELLPKIRQIGQENASKQLTEMALQLEATKEASAAKDEKIANLEKRQVRLDTFVRNVRRMDKNQIFYLASTENYAFSHLYEYGGVATVSEIKSRISTYNTGRAEKDLMYVIKIYKCHKYSTIENLIGAILAQFKDKPNGRKEMVRLKYSHLVGVVDIVMDACDQSFEHVNEMCHQFLRDTIDTDGEMPPPLDLDELTDVQKKRRAPRPSVGDYDEKQLGELIEEIVNQCIQNDLNEAGYSFREHKDTRQVNVPWGLLAPHMKEYRGLTMTQWRTKFKTWLDKEKPAGLVVTGIKFK